MTADPSASRGPNCESPVTPQLRSQFNKAVWTIPFLISILLISVPHLGWGPTTATALVTLLLVGGGLRLTFRHRARKYRELKFENSMHIPTSLRPSELIGETFAQMRKVPTVIGGWADLTPDGCAWYPGPFHKTISHVEIPWNRIAKAIVVPQRSVVTAMTLCLDGAQATFYLNGPKPDALARFLRSLQPPISVEGLGPSGDSGPVM